MDRWGYCRCTPKKLTWQWKNNHLKMYPPTHLWNNSSQALFCVATWFHQKLQFSEFSVVARQLAFIEKGWTFNMIRFNFVVSFHMFSPLSFLFRNLCQWKSSHSHAQNPFFFLGGVWCSDPIFCKKTWVPILCIPVIAFPTNLRTRSLKAYVSAPVEMPEIFDEGTSVPGWLRKIACRCRWNDLQRSPSLRGDRFSTTFKDQWVL